MFHESFHLYGQFEKRLVVFQQKWGLSIHTYIYIEKLEINRVDGQGATFVALHGKDRKNPPAAAR